MGQSGRWKPKPRRLEAGAQAWPRSHGCGRAARRRTEPSESDAATRWGATPYPYVSPLPVCRMLLGLSDGWAWAIGPCLLDRPAAQTGDCRTSSVLLDSRHHRSQVSTIRSSQ